MIRSIAASLLIATAAHAEIPEQLYAPMNTKMTRVTVREHFCDCVIYSVGQYRVAEIGSVRLAVKTEKTLDDKPTVVNLPLNTRKFNGSGKVGDYFSYSADGNVVNCELGGLRFQLLDKTVDVLGFPIPSATRTGELVIVDQQKIVSREDLKD